MEHKLNANIYAIVKLPFGFEYQMNFNPYYKWYEYYNHESSQHPEWAGEGGKSERKIKRHSTGRSTTLSVGKRIRQASR